MRDCDMFRGFAIGEGDELVSIPPHGNVKGRWVHGSYVYTKDSSGAEVHCIWGLDHGPDRKLVEKITLGRCTGVFDSEDEIVYEGDILKCEDEQAIMAVNWLEKDAYFTLHYMYKDGIHSYQGNYCVPFGHFLKAGKRFTVIGNKITSMKQLCVHFPDYNREPAPVSKQKLSARELEIIRGRETIKSLDEETQRQLKAYVKQTLRPQAGVKNTPVVTSPGILPVTIKPFGPQQGTGGCVSGKVPGGLSGTGVQKVMAVTDAAKKPVAVPVKPVTPPAVAIRIEIPLEEFVSACKLLMRKALGKKKNMVIFSARDSQFVLEWGNVGSILPAKGVWPEAVSIRGNNFLGITEVPPRQDPVVLEIKGEQFCVDGFVCACLVRGTPRSVSS